MANQLLSRPSPLLLSQSVILMLANEMLSVMEGHMHVGVWVVQEKFFFMARTTPGTYSTEARSKEQLRIYRTAQNSLQ